MRKSGVLLSVSSLPSKYGIGCFDEAAYKFVDDLVEAKQTYWQILPLGITGYGDSPYQSFSTFAGNPYFISLDEFVKCGYLKEEDLPEADINSDYVDYSYLYENRYALLKKAYENSHITDNEDFKAYCKDNAWWLEDYALFMAIKASYDNQGWENWPLELRLRNDASLTEKRNELSDDINYHKFLQYYVWKQWYALKDYANSKGVEIIGDIPIYVAYDSSDVWGQPELFQLDPEVKPTAVAGVPPDGFSADGQLWGDTTARNGHWEKGPGYDLFKTVEESLGKLNVIAEDLGYLTDTVKQMVADCGYPGMKVFEFAFDSRDSSGTSNYLPHNYTENSVVYTGTHDNETMIGWLKNILPEERQMLKDYLHYDGDDTTLVDMSIDCIMASVSDKCIVPMQDYLKLDNTARMNKPNTLGNNWMWRLDKNAFDETLKERMRDITVKTNRI